ncbi:MAG: hypothetical protein C0184_02935 [Chloroflexus aggregans]|uniref:DUF4013 domain-containing protein n=1 Tax=Chloroflexus aggregans TaxID=152260 RepID=A0A2J6XB89_9CHLR|nr:MAG: hypothetical protein C0184_02935 [Chloroflexus aggregans]
MNLTHAFSFVFDDPDWWKLILVIGLLQCIPIIGQIALLGCILLTARAVAQGNPQPLPRLNQLGAVLSDGVYGLLIAIVYYLPILAIVCILSCILVATIVSSGNNEPQFGIIFSLMFCLNLLLIPLILIIQPLLIIGSGRYIQTGSVTAALQLGEVVALLRRNPAEWLVLWLLSIVCNFVGGLGSIIFIVGSLFTTVYAALVFGHLLGQTVRQVASSPSQQ